jgi:hypothetical protein
VTLEQIVLDLETCRKLVESGLVLDTAMVWVPAGTLQDDDPPFVYGRDEVTSWEMDDVQFVPAPVLSELLDAIREKVHPKMLGVCGLFWTVQWIEPLNPAPLQERSTAKADDLLAAAALLMGVSK